jgi:glycosyltransferase involved in cell wall biosynthesis
VKAYAEAMIRLADHPELREKYGKAAKQRVVENFLNTTYAERIKQVIKEV